MSTTRKELSCTNKKRYTKVSHAKHDAREIRRKTEEIVAWYRCKICGWIHVGHKEW